MTKYFNGYLKQKCDEENIPFKDISDKMMLSDGTTDTKYLMDPIHLSQEIMTHLKEVFRNEIEKTNKQWEK